MKWLVSTPAKAYLFWRITRTESLKNCIGQYDRYFSAVKAAQGTQRQVLSIAALESRQKNIGKRQKSISSDKRSDAKRLSLMDFEICPGPWNYCLMRCFLKYIFKLGGLESLSLYRFTKCSVEAFLVVTNLLSEQRFSELEGLLTPECKQEVEKNLRNWTESELPILAIPPKKNEILTVPCDVSIFSDENKKKRFAEVTVMHYVWLPCLEEHMIGLVDFTELLTPIKELFGMDTSKKLKSWYVYTVFNCKFIKEITQGSTDQWTMSGINLKMYPQIMDYRIHKS